MGISGLSSVVDVCRQQTSDIKNLILHCITENLILHDIYLHQSQTLASLPSDKLSSALSYCAPCVTEECAELQNGHQRHQAGANHKSAAASAKAPPWSWWPKVHEPQTRPPAWPRPAMHVMYIMHSAAAPHTIVTAKLFLFLLLFFHSEQSAVCA